jgi:hypothetical protein
MISHDRYDWHTLRPRQVSRTPSAVTSGLTISGIIPSTYPIRHNYQETYQHSSCARATRTTRRNILHPHRPSQSTVIPPDDVPVTIDTPNPESRTPRSSLHLNPRPPPSPRGGQCRQSLAASPLATPGVRKDDFPARTFADGCRGPGTGNPGTREPGNLGSARARPASSAHPSPAQAHAAAKSSLPQRGTPHLFN